MNIAGNHGLTAAFLLAWAAKATVVLAMAWIAAFCLRARSAALRHRVWAIAIVGSLALPLVSLAVPAWHVISRPAVAIQTLSQTMLVMDSAALPTPATQPDRGLDIERLIAAGLLIWALGTMLVTFKLLAGLARLRRIPAYSTTVSENVCAALDELCASFGIKRRVRLLESASATMMPMTWGVFRPRVVLPSGASEWNGERRRVVLSHELSHVARNDWLLQFCAEVLRACFWFHPLAWIAARRLRQESERACDDAVLNSGIAAPEYANQLLALARTLKTPSWRFSLALAVARPSNLERRFAAMLNSSIRRMPLSRKGNFIAISLGACLLLPLAALTLSAETPANMQSAAVAQSGVPLSNQSLAAGDGSISGTIIDQRGMGIAGSDLTRARTKALRPGLTENSVLTHPSEATPVANAAPGQTAQSGLFGSISGSVGDPTGAMVPRATVTLTDVATGQQQQIATGPVGEFAFSNLTPDGYELSVAQPGFQVYRQTIQLYPSEALKLPELLLRVGEISQVVTVSAGRTGPASSQMPAASTIPLPACSAQTTQAAQLTFKDPVQPGPPPRRIRVGGMVEVARLVQQTLPIYPESARAAGMQGTVVMNAIISEDGTLLSTCVVAGPTLLARSAIDAVSQWRYSPLLLNGEPVEVVTQIAVVYSLTN